MSEQKDPTRNSGELRCSSPASETPIELLRLGPPQFKRPTLEEFEDAMIEDIERMSKEEIEAVALSSEAFLNQATQGAIKRVILVPGRLVNVVV